MNNKGVSLVEIILVISIVGMLILVIANLPNTLTLIGKSNHLSLAKEIASKQIEDKRALQYINLSSGTTNLTSAVDSRMGLLPSSSGSVVVGDPEDNVRAVSVAISWQENDKTQTYKIDTLIGEGGLSKQ